MRFIAILLLLLMITSATEDRISPKEAAQFLQGFLTGAFGEEFKDIEECMQNTDGIIREESA